MSVLPMVVNAGSATATDPAAYDWVTDLALAVILAIPLGTVVAVIKIINVTRGSARAHDPVWMYDTDSAGNPSGFYGWKVVFLTVDRRFRLLSSVGAIVTGSLQPVSRSVMVCPDGRHSAPAVDCHGCGFHAYAEPDEARINCRTTGGASVVALARLTGSVNTYLDPPGLIGQYQEIVMITLPAAANCCGRTTAGILIWRSTGIVETRCAQCAAPRRRDARRLSFATIQREIGVPVVLMHRDGQTVGDVPVPQPRTLPKMSRKNPDRQPTRMQREAA